MENTRTASREEKFVSFVLNIIKKDRGARAALRRGDHETTEFQSWEFLAPWCDLERENERRAFALVASSIARVSPENDGDLGLGRALASAYSSEKRRHQEQSSPAHTRLRRLIACKSAGEVIKFLRSTFRLLESRGVRIKYSEVLRDLLFFSHHGEKIKARWAKNFYGSMEE